MANAPSRLTTVPYNTPGDNPVDAPGYVSARALAQSVAESITIPASGGAYVRVAATCNIFYCFTGPASAAAPVVAGPATVPGDTDDGSACELLKVQGDVYWLKVPPGATGLSVITGDSGGGIVTASFFSV